MVRVACWLGARYRASMSTYKQFVASLGENAQRYSPEELRRLYVDVRRLAQIMVGVIIEERQKALRVDKALAEPSEEGSESR